MFIIMQGSLSALFDVLIHMYTVHSVYCNVCPQYVSCVAVTTTFQPLFP